jgi:nanoRNase/pAp phosphatase (c-di-AMP/oligoRNAs hydrolase)
LRSDKAGRDVSAIAKRHGGGGHKHAAGFVLEGTTSFPFPLAQYAGA